MRKIGRITAMLLLGAMLPWGMLSCQRESMLVDDASVHLAFSTDTLTFDTVFTTIGSTTLRLTVYNRTGDDLLLREVTLAGGRQSRFRLNVDGDTSLVARNVEIEGGDSLFVFVQVNINPNDSTEPFLVEDAILFSNGQRLPLTAWGRNAIYHTAPADSLFIRVGSETWTAGLPHIILGNLLVTEGNTLTLQAGTELRFGDGAMLIVDSTARLVAQGTAEAPVLFTSLRHDGWYSFLPGQWQTLWFYNYSTGNIIDHAVVENATGGLRVYPGATLSVSNTMVRNMADCGLIGQGGTISGRNLLVYDCLADLVALWGGSYDFLRCTFADYWSYSSRTLPAVTLSNCMAVGDSVVGGDLRRADFTDCIIWGTYYSGELLLSAIEGYSMSYRFNHSIVRGGEWDEDPLFTDPSKDDYTLQEGSPATGIGYPY